MGWDGIKFPPSLLARLLACVLYYFNFERLCLAVLVWAVVDVCSYLTSCLAKCVDISNRQTDRQTDRQTNKFSSYRNERVERERESLCIICQFD